MMYRAIESRYGQAVSLKLEKAYEHERFLLVA